MFIRHARYDMRYYAFVLFCALRDATPATTAIYALTPHCRYAMPLRHIDATSTARRAV